MGARPKLLLIHDDPRQLLQIGGLLEADYSVRGATSTGEATLLLAREEYCAVLCAALGSSAELFYIEITETYPRYRRRFVVMLDDEQSEEAWSFVEQCEIPHVTLPFDAASLRRVLAERIDRPAVTGAQGRQSERREHHRVSLAADLRIRANHADEDPEFATTINFSKQGFLFSSPRSYRAGDRVLLIFPYSGRLSEPERSGYVVRVEEQGGGTRLVAVVLGKDVPASLRTASAASA